jgi:hypothetical protein
MTLDKMDHSKEKGVILEYLDERKFDENTLAKDIKWLKDIKKEINDNANFTASFMDVFLANDKLKHLNQKYNQIKDDFARKFHENEQILIQKSKGLSKKDKLLVIFSLGTTYPYLRNQRKHEIELRTNYRSWNLKNYIILEQKVLPRIDRLLKKLNQLNNTSLR